MGEWETRNQRYVLRFFDVGIVSCVDIHEGPNARCGPLSERRLDSIGVFEVCNCKMRLLIF